MATLKVRTITTPLLKDDNGEVIEFTALDVIKSNGVDGVVSYATFRYYTDERKQEYINEITDKIENDELPDIEGNQWLIDYINYRIKKTDDRFEIFKAIMDTIIKPQTKNQK